jgi:hypothetical protein
VTIKRLVGLAALDPPYSSAAAAAPRVIA